MQKRFATRKPAEEFIGGWKLISMEIRLPSGETIEPMSGAPVGRIAYDAAGRMSVQIMRPYRPRSAVSAEDKAALFDGYLAYYGTYTVSAADHSVTHHIEASLDPALLGDLRRVYEFSGSRLVLRGPLQGGEVKLVWERAR